MPAPDRLPVHDATPPAPRSRYTDAEKAVGLAACAMFAPDYEAAAGALAAAPNGFAVPAETLRNWHSKGRGVNPDAVALAGEVAVDMAEMAREVAELSLGMSVALLRDARDELARFREAGIRVAPRDAIEYAEKLARVGALAVDRYQLLSGGATEQTESRTMNLHAFLPKPNGEG